MLAREAALNRIEYLSLDGELLPSSMIQNVQFALPVDRVLLYSHAYLMMELSGQVGNVYQNRCS
ncbi:hypothetical protein CSA37_02240 [Candidatus Fermentibacteria bacterium]|nr:MAG: hypothetical protein CSA37_02240 [Candidatus Fermentibacteria bacterium]